MTATEVDPQAFADTLRTHAGDLRTKLFETAIKVNELREQPEDKRGDTYAADLRSAAAAVQHLDAELNGVEHLLTPLPPEQRAPEAPESRGPDAAFHNPEQADTRSIGQMFVDNDDYAEWAKQSRSASTFFERTIERGERTLLDSTGDLSNDGAGLWRPVGTPMAPTPRQQRLFLRDVLLSGTTGLASIPYIREKNVTTNETGATAVAEGTAKPEVVMEFTSDTAPVRKIAAWIPATEEILEDAPTLRSYIDARLTYMIKLREEKELLNGGGNSPNLKGILDFTVQTQSAVTESVSETVGQAIGKVENVDGFPNFVAYNPITYWTAVTKRHANQFDNANTNGPAPSGVSNISWGLTELRTRGLAAAKALVGDGSGAQVFERRGVTIRVGNQHSDWFVSNKIAILAEERLALAVYRPDLFVDTTVPTS
jgi:HK97 family phage major capsid protein